MAVSIDTHSIELDFWSVDERCARAFKMIKEIFIATIIGAIIIIALSRR